MKIRFGTTPIAALPQELPVGGGRTLLLLPGSTADAIVQWNQTQDQRRELSDLALDLVWWSNLDEEAMVIGSEDGHHVYVVDLKTLEVTQAITVLHDEDKAWEKFAILVTPDGAHVVVVSELKFVILA
jgi:hypothetical protein